MVYKKLIFFCLSQFMNAEGKWTTDFDHKATCRQDKVEILEYCKKVKKQILKFIWKELNFTNGKVPCVPGIVALIKITLFCKL